MPDQPDLSALIELLELEVEHMRPSSYQGVELVLGWEPYRVITVVGYKYFLVYSKHQFPGSTYDGLGCWTLEI